MFKIFFQKPTALFIEYKLIKSQRASLKQQLVFWCFPLLMDQTNNLSSFYRNRLRIFLFPFLKYFLNSSFERKINSFIYILLMESLYFKQLIKNIFYYFLLSKNIPELAFCVPFIVRYKIVEKLLKHTKISFKNKDIYFILKNLFKLSKAKNP